MMGPEAKVRVKAHLSQPFRQDLQTLGNNWVCEAFCPPRLWTHRSSEFSFMIYDCSNSHSILPGEHHCAACSGFSCCPVGRERR